MRLRLAILVAFAALAAAPSAAACACCAEQNEWFQYTDRIQTRELNRVRFAQLAFVFPDTERIQGISHPLASYGLVVARSGRAWTLKLGTRGALTFTLPLRAEQYGADLHDGKMGGGGGPLLYKELRIRGTTRGGGDFKGGAFTLVLMGRGNNCFAAESYTRWRIEVSGKGVRYALRGTLAKPRS